MIFFKNSKFFENNLKIMKLFFYIAHNTIFENFIMYYKTRVLHPLFVSDLNFY